MKTEKKHFFILLIVLIGFTCMAYFFENQNSTQKKAEQEITASAIANEENDKSETVEIKAGNENNSDTTNSSDFFTDYRISRSKQRDAAAENYRKIAEDVSRTEESRAEANNSLQQLLNQSAAEDSIEKILQGRNYRDALFIYNETMPILIIKQKTLAEREINDLKNFVAAYLNIGSEIISVFNVWQDKGEV